MSEDKKYISFRADPELVEWFERNFPAHGSKQWFFESCLKSLRAKVKDGEIEPPVHLPHVTLDDFMEVL